MFRRQSRRPLPDVVPVTVISQIDSTHYRAFRQGAWYELFTPSAANLNVGDLVFARRVGNGQLFLPVVGPAGGAVLFGLSYNNLYPTVLFRKDDDAGWTENRSGLPNVSTWENGHLVVDPTNINKAWLLLATSGVGSGDFALYGNTGLTTGGSWTLLYDWSDLRSDAGFSANYSAIPQCSWEVCPTNTALAGMMVTVYYASGTPQYLSYWVHSHDNWVSRTAVDASTLGFYVSNGPNLYMNFYLAGLCWGRNTEDVVYLGGVLMENVGFEQFGLWRSDDHHTWTPAVTHDNSPYLDHNVPCVIKENNADDMKVYLLDHGLAQIMYSSNGGPNAVIRWYYFEVPYSLIDSYYFPWHVNPDDDEDYLFVNTSSDEAMYSSDGADTFTADGAVTNLQIFAAFAKTTTNIVKAGNLRTTNIVKVYKGYPGSWTDITGDIDSVASDPPIAVVGVVAL